MHVCCVFGAPPTFGSVNLSIFAIFCFGLVLAGGYNLLSSVRIGDGPNDVADTIADGENNSASESDAICTEIREVSFGGDNKPVFRHIRMSRGRNRF